MTTSLLVYKVWGSVPEPIKSNTVLLTSRRCSNVSAEFEAWLPWGKIEEMAPLLFTLVTVTSDENLISCVLIRKKRNVNFV